MKEQLRRIMNRFDGSYINDLNELILVPKQNIWFRLDDVETKEDLNKKIISWVSGPVVKFNYYNQEWRNKKAKRELIQKMNDTLDIDLDEIEWKYIYSVLGNNINPYLLDSFAKSNYNMKVFNQKDLEDYKELMSFRLNR